MMTRCRPAGLWGMLVAVGCGAMWLCGGGRLVVSPAWAVSGKAADLCVSMGTGGEEVSGLQMDLAWDNRCMSANMRGANAAACAANQATGKNVQTRVTAGSGTATMRALFFSVSDVSPIPEGELFCCTFTYGEAPDPCCSLALGNVIASDPQGQRVSSGGISIAATMGGTTCVSASPGGSGAAPVRGPLRQVQPAGGPPAVSNQPPPGAAPGAPRAGLGGAPERLAQGGPQEGAGTAPEQPTLPVAATAAAAEETPPATAAAPTSPAAAMTPTVPKPTPAVVPTTPRPPAATKTPTPAAPTYTPTAAGGFLSGCNAEPR
jgi:hypothetical protein